MGEKLELTTPEISPDLSNWTVIDIYLNRDIPCIKIKVRSNITGKDKLIRYIPDLTDPSVEDMIRSGLSFINQGKFKTVQNKSLQRWLLEKLRDDGHLGPGNIIGSPD